LLCIVIPNPIHYWSFSGDYLDAFGGAHLKIGSAASTVSFAPDRFQNSNSALHLNKGFMKAPPGIYFNGSFTITCWINLNSSNGASLRIFDFSQGNLINGVFTQLFHKQKNWFTGNIFGPKGWDEQSRLETCYFSNFKYDTWTYLAFTYYSNSTMALFINGAHICSKDNNIPVQGVERTSNMIGGSNIAGDASFPIGYFDDIKIYNVGLTSDQIYYDFISQFNAPSGSIISDKNSDEIVHPEKSQVINVDEVKNKYSNFIYETDSRFKNNDFIKNNIDQEYLNSDISLLIDNVKSFAKTGFINKHSSDLIRIKNKMLEFKNKKNNNKIERSLLIYLQATISSFDVRQNSENQKALVIDLEKHLEQTLSLIKNWKTLDEQNLNEIYRANYEKNLKSKINEANTLIGSLNQDIQGKINELNKDIVKILDEILKLKNDVIEEDNMLFKEKEKLKKSLVLKAVFKSIQVAASVISCINPTGALIGSIIDSGANIGYKLTDDTAAPRPLFLNNNYQFISAINAYQNTRNSNQLKKLETNLEILEMKNQFENKNLVQQRNLTFEERVRNLPNSSNKYDFELNYAQFKQINSTNKAEKQHYKNLENEARKKLNMKVKRKRAALKTLDTGLNIAESIVDFGLQIKEDSNTIKIVEDEINKNMDQFNQLNLIEKVMSQLQNTLFKEMNDEIDLFVENLNTSSIPLLDFKRLKIKETLNSIKNELFSLTSLFESHNQVSNTISQIENALQTMIDIHIRIETFAQQNEFANFIANIIRHKDSTIPEIYKGKLNSLENIINENIIVERYQEAVEAFKYWSFPFDCKYAKDIDIDDTESFAQKINNYEKHLEMYLSDVRDDKIKLNPSIDNHVMKNFFSKNDPFFQWSSKNHPYDLKRLLSGQPTTLYADVSFSEYEAVKFSTLEILIESDNPSSNKTLNELLENFLIEMTHSGQSYYKYENKISQINMNYKSEKLLLKFQYGFSMKILSYDLFFLVMAYMSMNQKINAKTVILWPSFKVLN